MDRRDDVPRHSIVLFIRFLKRTPGRGHKFTSAPISVIFWGIQACKVLRIVLRRECVVRSASCQLKRLSWLKDLQFLWQQPSHILLRLYWGCVWNTFTQLGTRFMASHSSHLCRTTVQITIFIACDFLLKMYAAPTRVGEASQVQVGRSISFSGSCVLMPN